MRSCWRRKSKHPPAPRDVDQPLRPSRLRLGPSARGHERPGCAGDDVPGHDQGDDGRGREPVHGLFLTGGGDAAEAGPGGGDGLRPRGWCS